MFQLQHQEQEHGRRQGVAEGRAVTVADEDAQPTPAATTSFNNRGSGDSVVMPSTPPVLPPMLRKLIDRSRQQKPSTEGEKGYVYTRELKRATPKSNYSSYSEASRRSTFTVSSMAESEDGPDAMSSQLAALTVTSASGSASVTLPPLSSSVAPSPVPTYASFQTLCQTSQSTLSTPGFPLVVSSSFERSAYWAKAPPKMSKQTGAMAWLFLHYALPRPEDVHQIRSIAELESPSLRLSFRDILFLAQDWSIVPQITSKSRLATLYQMHGVEKGRDGSRRDVGVDYDGFVKYLATIACESKVQQRNALVQKPGAPPQTAAGAAAASAAVSTGSATDRTMAMLHHLGWTSIEYVASKLSDLCGNAWYRKRTELNKAKSVYMDRPTCIFRCGPRKDATTLIAKPCPHATAPQWEEVKDVVTAGVNKRPLALHVDPHHHSPHTTKMRPSTAMVHSSPYKKAGSRMPRAASSGPHRSSSTSSLHSNLSSFSSTSSLTSTSSASSFASSSSSSSSYTLTPSELQAYKTIRTLDRLPLESNWCAYPGPYVDMGTVEVLPAKSLGMHKTLSGVGGTTPRRHRYQLVLQNVHAASLRVHVEGTGCEWLSLEYPSNPHLAAGMKFRIRIRAPLHMPEDALMEGTSSRRGSSKRQSMVQEEKQQAGDINESRGPTSVERLGVVHVTVENTWTYEISRVSIPVYARLVLHGSSSEPLSSQPSFQPVPSTPALDSAAASRAASPDQGFRQGAGQKWEWSVSEQADGDSDEE